MKLHPTPEGYLHALVQLFHAAGRYVDAVEADEVDMIEVDTRFGEMDQAVRGVQLARADVAEAWRSAHPDRRKHWINGGVPR